ncbi:spermidine/putrescine-binding periplasmic protein [Actinobacillus equuli]|nr:spermidine/putrescine-binding periplasmic protein [Actinobacillus equuli]
MHQLRKINLRNRLPDFKRRSVKTLPKEITEDPAIYPTADVLKAAQWQDDVGDAIELYENITKN